MAALAATVALTIPAALTWSHTRQGLHTTYNHAAAQLAGQAELSSTQRQALDQLFAVREEQERHLRKQMRTTYTPVQQLAARRLWEQRNGRSLTPEQRLQLRAQLRVTTDQEAQFQAYEAKLRAHRKETLVQAYAVIGSEEPPILLSALDDFQQL